MMTKTRKWILPDLDQNRTRSRIATFQAVEEEEAKCLRKFVIQPIQTRRNANNSEQG